MSSIQNVQSSIQVEIKTAEFSSEDKKSLPLPAHKEKISENNINIISTNKDKKIVFTEAILEPKKEIEKPNGKIFMYVCLICKRKFENEEKLRLHEKLSDMHRVYFKKNNKTFFEYLILSMALNFQLIFD
jgi:hypothetical protein